MNHIRIPDWQSRGRGFESHLLHGTLVKDYRLTFVKGDFEKTLLAAVGEYHNSIKFYEHTFTYNQVGTIEFAATPEIIKLSEVPTLPLLDNVP